MGISKDEIRKKYIEIRKRIENRDEKSRIIFNRLIESDKYIDARVIAIYYSMMYEVDTTYLINYSLDMGKVVGLPKVVGSELEFYRIMSLDDDFIKSNFGVLEPIGNGALIKEFDVDLVIVPGVCFDMFGNRIGYGKGYYDRFLKKCKGESIAICFDEQVLKYDVLPVFNFDEKVQEIITDKKIYKRSKH